MLIVEILGRFVPRDQLFVQVRVTVLQPVALFTASKVLNVLLVLYLTFKRCLEQHVRSFIFECVSVEQVNMGHFPVLRSYIVLEFPLINVELFRLKPDLVILDYLLKSVCRVAQKIQKFVHHQRVPCHFLLLCAFVLVWFSL